MRFIRNNELRPHKTHRFVLLNVVKDLYIAEIQNIRILHYVQKDSSKRFYKGLEFLRPGVKNKQWNAGVKQKLAGHARFEQACNKIPFLCCDGQHVNTLFFDEIFQPLLNIHGFE